MRTILFVCTGNTCRSPMAEAITRHGIEAGEYGEAADLFVTSAGVATGGGSAPTHETVVALTGLGIEHQGISTPLTGDMIRKADHIFCMTETHRLVANELVADSPSDQAKIMLLSPGRDIEDPIGMGQAAYDALARQFAGIIPPRLKEVLDL